MLILYYRPACPFCQRVLQVAENLKINLELKDVGEDESALTELLEKGGMTQVPYLVDTDKVTEMYESSDIIEYLRDNYTGQTTSSTTTNKPRIHVGSSVCESCEG